MITFPESMFSFFKLNRYYYETQKFVLLFCVMFLVLYFVSCFFIEKNYSDVMNEEQTMEWEVLESIYSADENYKKMTDNRLQYKLGVGSERSFIMEIEWPDEYPAIAAVINMDVYYNSQIAVAVRNNIRQKLLDVAKENEGMAASFSLIEWAKENFDELTSVWEVTQAISLGEAVDENRDDAPRKQEPLTKAAKRRMWNRNEGAGFERGYDWVDIVKHLSQTRDTD